MSFRVSKEYVWVAVIDDRLGSLADKLEKLSSSGVNLELIITRRERTGRALMFVSPLRTPHEVEVAHATGLSIAENFHNLRIEGPNGVGLGARITRAVSGAGISMRGYSAAALGDRHVTNVAFDSERDLARAQAVIEQALGPQVASA